MRFQGPKAQNAEQQETWGLIMPWARRGTKRYFYESRRENGRVVKRYRGAGEAAVRTAEAVARRKAERCVAAREIQAKKTARAAAAVYVEMLCRITDLFVERTLIR